MATFYALFAAAVLGCPPPPPKDGVFIGKIRSTTSKNLLWARLESYYPYEGDYSPQSITNATIDLNTGSVTAQDTSSDIIQAPNEVSDPKGGYQLQVSESNATLLDPSGTVRASFQFLTSGGELVAPSVYDFFISQRLNRAFVFYDECFSCKPTVGIIDLSTSSAVFSSFNFYLVGSIENAIEAVYDEIQLVALSGSGTDCISVAHAYYNESSVLMTLTDSQALDAISYGAEPSENSAFLISHSNDYVEVDGLTVTRPISYAVREVSLSSGETLVAIELSADNIRDLASSNASSPTAPPTNNIATEPPDSTHKFRDHVRKTKRSKKRSPKCNKSKGKTNRGCKNKEVRGLV
jgi:hypothetical protein